MDASAGEGSRRVACSHLRTPQEGWTPVERARSQKAHGAALPGSAHHASPGQPSPAAPGDASPAYKQPSFFKETRPLSVDQRTSEAKGSPREARRQPQPCLKIAR